MLVFPDWLWRQLTPVSVDTLDEELSPPLVKSSTDEADNCCFRILWFMVIVSVASETEKLATAGNNV